MASNLLKAVTKRHFQKAFVSCIMQRCAASHSEHAVASPIGNREIVGFGLNGDPTYYDRYDVPMPAIRFKEPTPEIRALQEKEKGDWKNLTVDEKKLLYRASFCQTFAEMEAPSGEWKILTTGVLLSVSVLLWVYMLMRTYVYNPLPDSFSAENKQKMLQIMIDGGANPIEGLASKYDYENNRWKN